MPAHHSRFLISTEALPRKDRLPIWNDLYCRNMPNLGISPHGDKPYRASICVNRFLDTAVMLFDSSSATYVADRISMQHAPDTVVVFTAQNGRALGSQKGRDALIRSAEGFILLNSEMASVNLLDPGQYLTISVPRAMLRTKVSDLEQRLISPQSLQPEALQLLTGYAQMLRCQDIAFSNSMAQVVSTHLIDLVANTLGASAELSEDSMGQSIRAARLEALKADMAANFTTEGFSTQAVAARLGVSPRYIRMLLESDGTTFTDLTLKMRLDHVYRQLRDPRFIARSISAIAYDSGFGDLSYFNRTFRRQFGITPSDLRCQRSLSQGPIAAERMSWRADSASQHSPFIQQTKGRHVKGD